MSEDPKQAALRALESERKARALGLAGHPDAAVLGDWLGWMVDSKIKLQPPRGAAEESASPVPSRKERPAPARLTEARTPSEPTEWLRFTVSVRDASGNDPGEIAEAEWGVSSDDELVIRDLEDGGV